MKRPSYIIVLAVLLSFKVFVPAEEAISLEYELDILPAPASDQAQWGYIADDRIGDFRVYVDEARMLRVSWKGINLLLQGGEMYAPKQEAPAGKMPVYLFPNDILVRRTQEDGIVVYRWGYRLFEKGFRQINEARITTNRIVLTSLIEFKRGNRQDVTFHSFLFPGTLPQYGGSGTPEERIMGAPCRIVRKDESAYTKIYPVSDTNQNIIGQDENELAVDPMLASFMKKNYPKAIPWLGADTKEIVFPFKQNGEETPVRFSFSSSDPSVSLAVTAHAVSSLGGDRYPPATGVMRQISAHKKHYRCQLQMAIDVGSAATGPAAKMEAIHFEQEVEISVKSGVSYHCFYPEETKEFFINVDNRWNQEKKDLDIIHEVYDYNNALFKKGTAKVSLEAGSAGDIKIEIPHAGNGFFSLCVKAMCGKHEIGRKQIRYAVVPHPADIDAENSMFGLQCRMDMWNRNTPRRTKYETLIPFLKRLGYRSVRIMSWALRWNRLEKEEGKFTFDPSLDEIVDLFSKYGMSLWVSGGDFHLAHGGATSIPEWARGTETFHWRRPVLLPKNMDLYSNYISEIVRHFKGRIDRFECWNEPHRVDPAFYVKMLKVFHDGVKKGNPEAKVLGAAPCSIKSMAWVRKVVEDEGGAKYLDQIPYHHYIAGCINEWPLETFPAPEDNDWVPPIERINLFCKKYNLGNFIGEIGWVADYTGLFPEARFRGYERELAAGVTRAYILAKANGVRVMTQCYSVEPLRLNDNTKNAGSLLVVRAGSLWDGTYCLQPQSVAMANLASLVDGARFVTAVDYPVKRIYAEVFERDNRPVCALWSLAGKAKFTMVSKGTVDKVFDMFSKGTVDKVIGIMGNEFSPAKGRLSLNLTEEPVYLVGTPNGTESMLKKLRTAEIELADPVIILGLYRTGSDTVVLYLENRASQTAMIDSAVLKAGSDIMAVKKYELRPLELKNIPFNINWPLKPVEAEAKVTVNGREKLLKCNLEPPRLLKNISSATDKLEANYAGTPPVIDGDLTDWKGAPAMRVDTVKGLYLKTDTSKWSGTNDLSANGYVMWDEKNFYFACEVRDDQHVQEADRPEGLWEGDSIEMVMETSGKPDQLDTGDFKIDLALTKSGAFAVRHKYGTNPCVGNDGNIEGAKAAIVRKDQATLYEIAIPQEELAPFHIEPGRVIKFNFIVNDNDGNGREKWAGITRGIGERRKPAIYKQLIFKKIN